MSGPRPHVMQIRLAHLNGVIECLDVILSVWIRHYLVYLCYIYQLLGKK